MNLGDPNWQSGGSQPEEDFEDVISSFDTQRITSLINRAQEVLVRLESTVDELQRALKAKTPKVQEFYAKPSHSLAPEPFDLNEFRNRCQRVFENAVLFEPCTENTMRKGQRAVQAVLDQYVCLGHIYFGGCQCDLTINTPEVANSGALLGLVQFQNVKNGSFSSFVVHSAGAERFALALMRDLVSG